MAGELPVRAPMAGTVAHVAVRAGDRVAAGEALLALESMKMEHPVPAVAGGRVAALLVDVGDTVAAGDPLARIEVADDPDGRGVRPPAGPAGERPTGSRTGAAPASPDLGTPRADLREVLERRALLADDARPDAVRSRRERGRRTARENVAALVDDGSFVEYGGLAIAAQRRRRSLEELIRTTPADGLVAGTATVNAELVGTERARCVVLAYDATVLAGTQGMTNHRKTDRILELAIRHRLPVVVLAEGGGGRPGDTDALGASWLDARAFHLFARAATQVPTVAIVDGYCFAGNAALAGCADLIVATVGSNLGMAGPAMVEGGGLGRVAPTEIGPVEVQRANGVVDVVVGDDTEGVEVARLYLGLVQGAVVDGAVADQRALRAAVPEDRRRVYDVRALVTTLVDEGSLLELRRDHAPGMLTALARIGGRPVGVLANDPSHLGGAIDAEGADSVVRHLELCDARGLPVVVLCDTPGFMVGPEAERDGGVRRFSRLFLAGARLAVPLVAVVTRKAYGLGAQAMLGGHLGVPVATLAWPTAELGPMGLEGAVRLGARRELEAIDDPSEREGAERRLVEQAYAEARALNVASYAEVDDVIDPADTRARVLAALDAAGVVPR